MLNKNKYWKSLLGTFAEVLIAKQVDYAGTGASAVTNTSDFKDFCDNAAEGEFGFFNADTLALISGATSGSPAAVTAVGTSVTLFAAVKRDGAIEKTSTFKLADFKASRAAYSAGAAQVSKATLSGTPVKGNTYTLKVIETTPGNQPFPYWNYTYVGKAGDAYGDVATAIAALINDTTNVINKDTDPIVTASVSGGVITVTAKTKGVTFRIAFSNDALIDCNAVAAYTGSGTTAPSYGSGTYDQIAELERESDVIKGIGTQYPMQGANPEDWGKPVAFAASGVTYDVYFISGYGTEHSPTPVERHYQKRNIILAIPTNGSANANAEVKGILGL